ncbi:MAG: hypothetical protein ACRD29_03375 [Acidimicrobiales bacterium]
MTRRKFSNARFLDARHCDRMGMQHNDVIARLRAMALRPLEEATAQVHLARARAAADRRRRRARTGVIAACLALLAAPAAAVAVGALDEPAPTQLGVGPQQAPANQESTQACVPVDQSTEEVLAGVTLTWDSSFLCADAPDAGSYTFTVTVTNAPGSADGVTVHSVELTHTTPRPGGQAPPGSGSAQGVPFEVSAGGTGSFSVSGTYELVETDEGSKANLHFLAMGAGSASGDGFELGINAHLRGPGAEESGPPAGMPPLGDECFGPPPFAEIPAQPADPAGGVVPSPRAEEATTFAETRAACGADASEQAPPSSVTPVPTAPPEGVPDGPPEGTPDGPPDDTPGGPPPGTPGGPPEGVPEGPPDWVPDPGRGG